MSLKVVNLGLPKSGTSTLARALRRGCLSCADHKIITRTEGREETEAYVGELMYKGYFDTGNPATYLDGFDSVSEMSVLRDGRSMWPQMDFGIIHALYSAHPDLRFVATYRDPFRMSQSMLAWSNMGDRLENSNIPGLPAGFGDTSKARVQWIEGHYAHLRVLFHDDPRYLELDIAATDAREKLSEHLGIDLPWWGSRNRNPLTRQIETQ